jgi:hypothetical protein
VEINCILNNIQPLQKGRDSSPRTQNVDHLRTRSCTPGKQTPPPSLPISRDLSVTEVESTGILGEDEESAISDAERVHVCEAYSLAVNMSSSSIKTHKASVTLSDIIAKARRQNPGNSSQTFRSATDEQR